jgi:hypothetical protein
LRRLWASQEGVEPLGGPFALPFQQVPVTIDHVRRRVADEVADFLLGQ